MSGLFKINWIIAKTFYGEVIVLICLKKKNHAGGITSMCLSAFCCFNTRQVIITFEQLTSAAQAATSATRGSATCTRSSLIRFSRPTFPRRRFPLDVPSTSALPFGRRLESASLLLAAGVCARTRPLCAAVWPSSGSGGSAEWEEGE